LKKTKSVYELFGKKQEKNRENWWQTISQLSTVNEVNDALMTYGYHTLYIRRRFVLC
jgi:hypothetical protein